MLVSTGLLVQSAMVAGLVADAPTETLGDRTAGKGT
jgi:hypothetical protein